ncbi:MAG TPA: PEP-CTERM sorting domain-containing protein [Tepidisphaeraceae bacterium]|nr:PEP-CTERM sorting domain-containing protein [Tepidisphaeraceae bacterium]
MSLKFALALGLSSLAFATVTNAAVLENNPWPSWTGTQPGTDANGNAWTVYVASNGDADQSLNSPASWSTPMIWNGTRNGYRNPADEWNTPEGFNANRTYGAGSDKGPGFLINTDQAGTYSFTGSFVSNGGDPVTLQFSLYTPSTGTVTPLGNVTYNWSSSAQTVSLASTSGIQNFDVADDQLIAVNVAAPSSGGWVGGDLTGITLELNALASVPEPSSLGLVGLGALGALRRKRA